MIPVLLLAVIAAARRQAPDEEASVADLFARVSGSVVTIRASGPTTAIGADGRPVSAEGVGSGVLVSEEGRILTAAHVVHLADVVAVEFSDGSLRPAVVEGSAPEVDLALVRVTEPPPRGAVVARLGDSSRPRIGSRVLVIGAPLGMSRTLTAGHLSARRTLAPPFPAGTPLELLQTDAAVNAGNSGGPMFDAAGDVVGIVSFVLTRSGGSDGLGFAVTSEVARELLLKRPPFWSGADYVLLAGGTARLFHLPTGRSGLLVQRVARGSPCARLGIRGGTIPATIAGRELLLGGDVILEAAGRRFDEENLLAVRDAIAELAPDDELRVLILRGGETIELKARFGSLVDRPR